MSSPANSPPRLPSGLPASSGPPIARRALLSLAPGHVLLSGTKPFMTAVFPEGTDAARARFTRHARRQAARHPDLRAVAAAYAPHHAWSHPADVPPDTATAHHLDLLREFSHGALPAPAFAQACHVFLLLEDYEVAADLAEPTHLTATELQAAVTAAYRSRSSNPWSPRSASCREITWLTGGSAPIAEPSPAPLSRFLGGRSPAGPARSRHCGRGSTRRGV